MNMKIVGKLSIQLIRAEPDLISNFMDTELSWNDVKVEGDFEFYQNSHHETPELINGTFRYVKFWFGLGSFISNWFKWSIFILFFAYFTNSMVWKNVKAVGSIGFLPFEHTDGFYSTALDLKFTSDGFDLQVRHLQMRYFTKFTIYSSFSWPPKRTVAMRPTIYMRQVSSENGHFIKSSKRIWLFMRNKKEPKKLMVVSDRYCRAAGFQNRLYTISATQNAQVCPIYSVRKNSSEYASSKRRFNQPFLRFLRERAN